MDRRLLAIPIVILFGAVLLSSGLMNTFIPEQEAPSVDQNTPDPSEPAVVMQKSDSDLPEEVEPESILEEAPAPAPMMRSMGSASPSETVTPSETVNVNTVVANFTADVDCLNVTFTDLSENASSWTWDFGDGNVVSEFTSPYTYVEAGTYKVNLTVSGDDEQSDYKEMDVVVYNCSNPNNGSEETKPQIPENQEIPEFPTIALPMLAIIGMAFFFNRKQ